MQPALLPAGAPAFSLAVPSRLHYAEANECNADVILRVSTADLIMELLYAHPYLSLAAAGLTVWMLIDAYWRRVEPVWFLVILLIPGLGALAYFVAVAAADYFRKGSAGGLFQARTSLQELRYRAEQVPTLANQLALAERLVERREYAEAVPHLESARKKEPEHSRVIYCLALCHARQGHSDLALALLDDLVRREPRWANYSAWHLLVEARAGAGDAQGALEACRELVRLAPTLQHRCLLAEHLVDRGLTEEARGLLERSLQDHYFAPGPIRRQNRRWASVARRLQRRALSR